MSTITSASDVFCWKKRSRFDGDRLNISRCARVVSALDPGSLMRDRPARARVTGILGGQSLAGLRTDSP
jgi:hypothetical protein